MAAPELRTVAKVDDVPPGSVRTVYAEDEPLALAHVDDEVKVAV